MGEVQSQPAAPPGAGRAASTACPAPARPAAAAALESGRAPVQEMLSTPGPKYSTMAPVPPLTDRMPATCGRGGGGRRAVRWWWWAWWWCVVVRCARVRRAASWCRTPVPEQRACTPKAGAQARPLAAHLEDDVLGRGPARELAGQLDADHLEGGGARRRRHVLRCRVPRAAGDSSAVLPAAGVGGLGQLLQGPAQAPPAQTGTPAPPHRHPGACTPAPRRLLHTGTPAPAQRAPWAP